VAKPFRVIAHRGASAHAPENTIPAFLLALELGAEEVELDIRFSSDLELVVFHDDSLTEKTSWSGRVCHYTAETLSRVDIGTWFDGRHPEVTTRYAGTTVARLEDVFEALGDRAHYHLEIKGYDDLLPVRLLQAVDRYGLRDQVTISSFSMRPLVGVRAFDPDVPVCLLLRDAADALRSAEFRTELEGATLPEVQCYWIEAAARAGFQQVGIRAEDVDAESVAFAEKHGLSARGWGVETPEQLERLIELGAIGATVDWPGRALDIVAAHGSGGEAT